MDVTNHIVFTEKNAPLLFAYFQENNIPFECGTLTCVADVRESDPHWKGIFQIMQRENVYYLPQNVFSPEELNAAQWLMIRSRWLYDYPQPEDHFQSVTYQGTCWECGSGSIQQAAFRFKKQPQWGRRSFCMTNWIEDELFLSAKAKEKLQQEEIPGISFRQVMNKSGTEALPDMYQMEVLQILPKGLEERSSGIAESVCCPRCGARKYHRSETGQCVFRKETFDGAPLIAKTAEIFGCGAWAARRIIVHQSIYQMIRKNNLDRSLEFEPIELV